MLTHSIQNLILINTNKSIFYTESQQTNKTKNHKTNIFQNKKPKHDKKTIKKIKKVNKSSFFLFLHHKK
ncbi:hypothetical protein CCO51_19415 [Salmonella enterica subsp. enterica serovar Plymouth]|nr:hypothetical protein [Salmonella enterica subsp. enterica serovar Pasing]OZU24674.1 hypothetical protein CCO51_19415 [Salmonella enterica subsp. enterica serovar Plymouth]